MNTAITEERVRSFLRNRQDREGWDALVRGVEDRDLRAIRLTLELVGASDCADELGALSADPLYALLDLSGPDIEVLLEQYRNNENLKQCILAIQRYNVGVFALQRRLSAATGCEDNPRQLLPMRQQRAIELIISGAHDHHCVSIVNVLASEFLRLGDLATGRATSTRYLNGDHACLVDLVRHDPATACLVVAELASRVSQRDDRIAIAQALDSLLTWWEPTTLRALAVPIVNDFGVRCCLSFSVLFGVSERGLDTLHTLCDAAGVER